MNVKANTALNQPLARLEMISGTVMFFSLDKGYGFAEPDGGGRMFFWAWAMSGRQA